MFLLFIPIRISGICIGNAFDFVFQGFRVGFFQFFCGGSGIYPTGLDNRTFGYDTSGGDNGIAPDDGIVQYYGPHTDEYVVVYGASVYNGIMSYGYVIAYAGRRFFVCGMYGGIILYVYLIAHFYVMYVASEYGSEPYAAIVAHFHSADDGGIIRNETIFSEFRFDTVEFFYYSHFLIVKEKSDGKFMQNIYFLKAIDCGGFFLTWNFYRFIIWISGKFIYLCKRLRQVWIYPMACCRGGEEV